MTFRNFSISPNLSDLLFSIAHSILIFFKVGSDIPSFIPDFINLGVLSWSMLLFVSFTASLNSWVVFNEPFSYFTCARFCTSFIPLQFMLLELMVSRLAGGQRPRSFWHSRLCFYEPL